MPDLKTSVTRASKWAFLGELVAKTFVPVTFLALARILEPADFGVAAAALMVIAFAQLLWDAGLGKSIIQRADRVEEAASAAFWSNVGLAALAYLVVVAAAHPLSVAMGDTRVAAVLRIQGLQIVITSLGGAHRALLQRNFGFRQLFWVRMASAVTPACAALPLAIGGWGYWALVAGSLAGALAELLAVWLLSAWKPSVTFDRAVLYSVWRFGLPVMGESILLWSIAWLDVFIVTRHLGTEVLGIYRGGSTLVTTVFTLGLSPLLPLAFAMLSRLQQDVVAFRNAFLTAFQATAMAALPITAWLVVLQSEVVSLALGAGWESASLVVGVLAAMQGVSWLVGLSPEAYRARGNPGLTLKISAFSLLYYLPVLWAAAQYGLATFLVARLCVALVAFPVHIYFIKKVIGVGIRALMYRLRWVIVGVMLQILSMTYIASVLPSDWTDIERVVAIGLTGLLFLGVGAWPEREFARRMVSFFIQR